MVLHGILLNLCCYTSVCCLHVMSVHQAISQSCFAVSAMAYCPFLLAGGTLVIACWCQREETPSTPLSKDEKDRLQFLYDEWAHPYFISNLHFGRLMEVCSVVMCYQMPQSAVVHINTVLYRPACITSPHHQGSLWGHIMLV